MNAHATRYHDRMNQIRTLLSLLRIEAEHAEEYRSIEGIEAEDVAELDRIIRHLAPAYGILVADEGIHARDILKDAAITGKE
ncbi:MAG: hypothetical protein LBJ46_08155 [Planctomycetota bacterium]|jgi:hypothetical protein|nr:hypothetical protein [Planctomycetota bacterium]